MVSLKGFRGAMIFILLTMTLGLVAAGKNWADNNDHLHDNLVEERAPKSHVNRLDVVCSKDHMTVHMFFDSPFYGMVFSQSSHHQERCIHVGPRAGVNEISFHIKYDGCGTVEDLSGQFHENTIVIQYGEDILEAWDEAKRLRCEWLESFDKESSKNSLAISEIDIVELNFQGDDIDCWMEVQEGKGPWARQVGGILPIGSPLTLVIAINDHSREFDMRVKKCVASDGSGSEVQLTDQNGCVLRPSLLTPFSKVRDFGSKATLVAYSHLFAFKFPDTLDVFVHCLVEVCRHGCPDSCGSSSLLTEHHPHPREHFHTLESKKHQKVVELTTSKPTTTHSVQASHHRQRPQYLTKVPVHVLHSLTGKAKKAQQSYGQNASLSLASPHPGVSKFGRISDEVNNNPIRKPEIQSSASNTYVVTEEDRNRFLNSNSGHEKIHNEQQAFSDVKSVPIGQYHKIIGHHAHWNSEEVRAKDEDYFKHHIPPSKDISYQQPTHPDLDKVKSLSKEEILRQHFGLKNTGHQEALHLSQPQPEPAAWSGDDVRPLTKEQVFHKQIPNHHATHFKEPHPIPDHLVPHRDLFGHSQVPRFQPHLSEAPKPEPAPWTFDEVRPMHNPGVRPQQEIERLQEPKPEPAAWSLDDVKPLTKEDLRFHSLNHKLKSHPHLYDDLPIYKESVLPYGTKSPSTAPSPVYVPKISATSKNMSSAMMMNMMMMMPTLLPFTYQTARWPQKTTAHARNLRPNRHNNPYPIPQFTNKQQLLMSVIADRREDSDEDLQFEMDPRSFMKNHSNSTVNPNEDAKQNIGTGAGMTGHSVPFQIDEPSMNNKPEESVATAQTASFGGDPISVGASDQSKTKAEGKPAAIRPPVAGFLPPTLDVGDINPFETKGKSVHSPRALNRRKRSSEPVFGVKQKFQAIALTDLAFEYNLTQDSTAVLRGRREEIIYGICMSPASMSVSVGFILLLTLCSLMASLLLYEHSCRLRNKTSHLSLLTRTFNGRLESLYRVSRPYPNSSVR